MFEAVAFLIRGCIVYGIFKVARKATAESVCPRLKAYAWAIWISIVLAFLSWGNLGTHMEDGDPIRGGGDQVVDFVPTTDERNQHGIFVFTVLVITSLSGTHMGLRDRFAKEGGNA